MRKLTLAAPFTENLIETFNKTCIISEVVGTLITMAGIAVIDTLAFCFRSLVTD